MCELGSVESYWRAEGAVSTFNTSSRHMEGRIGEASSLLAAAPSTQSVFRWTIDDAERGKPSRLIDHNFSTISGHV